MRMTGQPVSTPSDDISVQPPTDAEIESWAVRERRRREAWLRGPSETEKAIWAERERERRAFAVGGDTSRPAAARGGYLRQVQLATEGMISIVLSHSLRDVFDSLRFLGRAWEEEFDPPTNT